MIYGYVLKTSNRNGSIIHTLKCHFLLCFMFGALDFFLQLTSSQCVRRIRDSSAIGPIAMTTFESVAAWQVVEERMWFYRVFFVWLPRYRVTVHFDRISRREYFDKLLHHAPDEVYYSLSQGFVCWSFMATFVLVVGVVGVVIKMSFFSLQVFWLVI